MPPTASELAAPTAGNLKVLLAFAAVYLIWGSTYLGIRFAIETLPPFLMAGVRFLVAGALLYAWSRLLGGAPRPTRRQWGATAVVGLLLLLGGNGLVVWSETRVASGVAALLVGIVPCWMVLLEWLRPSGTRPARQTVLGLFLGLAGLFWLIGPDSIMGGGRADLLGASAVLVGSFLWAAGSIYSRHAPMPSAPFLSTAMQMLAASAALLLVSAGLGEPLHLHPGAFSARSLLALLYLVLFGSIVAFSAYIWLLRESTPARVSTYAYVNPVVAVLLGWALAGEALTPRMIVAAVVIVSGVVLITLAPVGALPIRSARRR
ncbi:MAG TPA: drug/metabolite exporter YedA [Gammaproteobacteria bacterium]|nr:drug/metabolite exporter YedA [Gammaproteobacteria bacterium]